MAAMSPIAALAALALLPAARAPLAAPADGGTLLVLEKSAARIVFVDAATLETRAALPTGTGPHEVAVSPDGRLAVVADYGDARPGRTLSVYAVDEPRLVRTIDLGELRRPHGIRFRDARRALVTCEDARGVAEVDVEEGRVLRVLDTGALSSHMLAVSPDGARVYTANIGSGSLSAIDLASGELLGTVATGAQAEGIDVSPDGREVWVTNRAADTVSVVDAGELRVVRELPCAGFPIRVTLTPDGVHALVTAPKSGEVVVFDARERRELRRVPMELARVELADGGLFGDAFQGSPVPVGILIEPGGRRAFVANTAADVVAVLDLATWRIAGLVRTGREPDGLAFSAVAAPAEARD